MPEVFATIQAHCLAKPGAWEDYPWGETVWKVKPKNKVFCFGGPTSMTVRATQNNPPSAWRLFWHYGPGQGVITVVSITPHP